VRHAKKHPQGQCEAQDLALKESQLSFGSGDDVVMIDTDW